MPEGQDKALSRFMESAEALGLMNFPTQAFADERYDPISQCGDYLDFKSLQQFHRFLKRKKRGR